ncbi:MAG: deoxyribonuclease V [Anaerolineae bacterium]|jgi:deoxyribonuclease V
MQLAVSHPWDLSVSEARALQPRLAEKVVAETTFDPSAVRTVAGVDVGFRDDVAQAAVVVLGFPDLKPLDYALGTAPVTFPYVPGLLTFREGPSVLDALEKLTVWPDLFVFDGHGLAHPLRIGLAAHMGVILDRASIGCAKSRLTGSHDEPGQAVGDWVPLRDRDEIIGAVVRSRANVKPLYVSVGHRVDLQTSIDLVLRCTGGYRLPETTRYAHRVAGGASLEIETTSAQLPLGDWHES